MTYTIGLERGDLNYRELEPNYRRHYAEMQARLKADGFDCPDYNPQLDRYFDYFRRGILLNFVARFDGVPVGHSNIYVTNDMHNGEPIAQEDMIYVVPEHRNGLGRRLARHVLDDLRKRGVKRLHISAVTDLRAEKLWQRMGFRPVAQQMTYDFTR